MSSEQQAWVDAMARWEGLVDATAERARRRDMFAAAALTGLASDLTLGGSWDGVALYAVRAADALLAALDATAGPTSASVPPQQPPADPIAKQAPMMTEWNEAAMRWESCPLCVTTSTGTKLMGMCVQYHDEENPGKYGPVWICPGDRMTVIHGVIGWEPIDVPPAPVSRPPETRQTQRGGA